MAARTGRQYLDELRDNRSVWVNGEAISDVTQSALFRGSLAGMAGYFDWQQKYADTCVIESEGGVCSVSHLIPLSAEDLVQRRDSPAHMIAQNSATWNQVPEFWKATDEITKPYGLGFDSGQ